MMFVDFVNDNHLGKVKKSSFKELTTISVGADILYLYIPNSVTSLIKAYKFVNDNNLEYIILGNGSNILASDNEYKGIVFSLRDLDYYYKFENDNTIEVSAFYPSNKLSIDLMNNEIGDLSCLVGIPGLLGGAIYNNSGSYKDSISDSLISVDYINTSGEIIRINNKNCAFGYRRSIFKYIKGIIISARFHIRHEDTKNIVNLKLKRRMESQPVKSKSMGSVFKNNPLIPSWKIVDALGLRGFQIGGAAVSQKHSNFIINLGNASAKDIISLIELIETRSRLELGISLVREIEVIN